MYQLEQAIRQMIDVSDAEMQGFLKRCMVKTFKRKTFLSEANTIANEIFFINKGIARLIITDTEGEEHTTYFALENKFIVDYTSFLEQSPAAYSIEAIEDTEAVVMPRAAIMWGYDTMQQGEKLGRLIAEYYFIYQDKKIRSNYTSSAADRYRAITDTFTNIHNRVPQHMIASYLGISPVHLSRLKQSLRG